MIRPFSRVGTVLPHCPELTRAVVAYPGTGRNTGLVGRAQIGVVDVRIGGVENDRGVSVVDPGSGVDAKSRDVAKRSAQHCKRIECVAVLGKRVVTLGKAVEVDDIVGNGAGHRVGTGRAQLLRTGWCGAKITNTPNNPGQTDDRGEKDGYSSPTSNHEALLFVMVYTNPDSRKPPSALDYIVEPGPVRSSSGNIEISVWLPVDLAACSSDPPGPFSGPSYSGNGLSEFQISQWAYQAPSILLAIWIHLPLSIWLPSRSMIT